jgi:hypothetical protein
MVVGYADLPLLQCDLFVTDLDLARGGDRLVAAAAAEHERAGIDGVGQQVVDGAEARRLPTHPLLADGASWQQVLLADELGHDLPGGRAALPCRVDMLDRATDLLIGSQPDRVGVVAF